MNSTLKYLIVVTLIYYFVKGLIYLLLWQTTYKVEERARERIAKEKEKREMRMKIWEDDDEDL